MRCMPCGMPNRLRRLCSAFHVIARIRRSFPLGTSWERALHTAFLADELALNCTDRSPMAIAGRSLCCKTLQVSAIQAICLATRLCMGLACLPSAKGRQLHRDRKGFLSPRSARLLPHTAGLRQRCTHTLIWANDLLGDQFVSATLRPLNTNCLDLTARVSRLPSVFLFCSEFKTTQRQLSQGPSLAPMALQQQKQVARPFRAEDVANEL